MRNAQLLLFRQRTRLPGRILQILRSRVLSRLSADSPAAPSHRQRIMMAEIAATLHLLEGLTKLTIDTGTGIVVGWQDDRVIYTACYHV
jgi:hypothetical protein